MKPEHQTLLIQVWKMDHRMDVFNINWNTSKILIEPELG